MKKILAATLFTLGATMANAGVINTGFDDESGLTVLGDAIVSGGTGQLTQDTFSQRGAILFDNVDDNALVQGFSASFDFSFLTANDGADGISFGLHDSTTAFDVFSFLGEEGSDNGLSVGFDSFQNSDLGDVSDNSVSVNFNGDVLAQFDLNATSFVLDSGELFTVVIEFSDGELDVLLNGVTIFDGLAINGWSAYAGNYYFAGRTGGFSSLHEVDNLSVNSNVVSAPSMIMLALFGVFCLFIRKMK